MATKIKPKKIRTPSMGKCSTHPKYTAVRKPKVLCFECWRQYFMQNPKTAVTGEDMYFVVNLLSQLMKAGSKKW